MISQDRMEQALRFLAETDEDLANTKTDAERFEYVAKRTKAMVFLHSEGTVAERQALAEASDEYQKAVDRMLDKKRDAEAMAAKRKTESTVLDCWRSLNANRRLSA